MEFFFIKVPGIGIFSKKISKIRLTNAHYAQ